MSARDDLARSLAKAFGDDCYRVIRNDTTGLSMAAIDQRSHFETYADAFIKSDWVAPLLAAERERIAQAIEAELAESQKAAETTLAGSWQYQDGIARALTIARTPPP